MRRNFTRVGALLCFSLFLASSSSAYYYYVHYDTSSGTYTPILEKFDLSALNSNTVSFFISGQGPSKLVPGDSFLAIVSQIRSAAAVWNNVSTSSLRLSYGGLFTIGTQAKAPQINIEFSDEIPPGLLALSGPETQGNVQTGSDGHPFVPIVDSKMLLPADLSQLPGPSYTELFFTTVVHEFGHTMGLQHTLTSSVMSTAITSASTKAIPLAQDDIAAISLLYPTSGFSATVGSIRGRVTLPNGNGVGLASVVALSPGAPAVSALTNPDGTYEIDGLPALQYYVYVHPLPPAQLGEAYPANITPPKDLNGHIIPSGPNFVTQFYPGTRNFNQAQLVPVTQGNVTGGIYFTVTEENEPAISSVRVYGYSSDGVPLASAPMLDQVPAAMVATGASGLLNSNGSLSSGLAISAMGNPALIYNLQPYDPPYLSFNVYLNGIVPDGPQHLLFSTPNDLYVLPSAFSVVANPPPFMTGITPGFDSDGNRLLMITGTNFQADTRIFFDGLPGTVQSINAGVFMVTPPPAPGGYTASVVAVNTSDPQSSLFLQPVPYFYTYDSAPNPTIVAAPLFLSPGQDTLVDIYTKNLPLSNGQLSVGFGTADVQVKSTTILSPTHAQVVATAPAGQSISTAFMTVTNGLGVYSYTQGFSILP